MSCKLQTENISNILCNYLIYVLHTTSYFWADFAIFQYNLSVPVYCIDPNLLNLPFCHFFPLSMDLPSHKRYSDLYCPFYLVPCSMQWWTVSFSRWLQQFHTYFYYFVDAGSWRRNVVTPLTDSLVVTLSTDLLIFPLFELLMSVLPNYDLIFSREFHVSLL